MRMFNNDKTEEIKTYDANLFYAVNDTIPFDKERYKELSPEEKRSIICDNEMGIEYILKLVPFSKEELDKRDMARLRVQRAALLTAFDKWEKAVLRGREEDDESIMQWYRKLLDLEEEAFENVPERIKYYL